MAAADLASNEVVSPADGSVLESGKAADQIQSSSESEPSKFFFLQPPQPLVVRGNYQTPPEMEPFSILEEATQNIVNSTSAAGSSIRMQMESSKVRLQQYVIQKGRQCDDLGDSSDEETSKTTTNSNPASTWTRSQQDNLEKEIACIYEFLDSFHLVGQQLEFIASQVNNSSCNLAEQITNWCSAEYGWRKHIETLQSRTEELRRKVAQHTVDSAQIKHQMQKVGDELNGSKKLSWFQKRSSQSSLEKLALQQHQSQQSIAQFEEQIEQLESTKLKFAGSVDRDLEEKRIGILGAVKDVQIQANFVVGYKTDPTDRLNSLKSEAAAVGLSNSVNLPKFVEESVTNDQNLNANNADEFDNVIPSAINDVNVTKPNVTVSSEPAIEVVSDENPPDTVVVAEPVPDSMNSDEDLSLLNVAIAASEISESNADTNANNEDISAGKHVVDNLEEVGNNIHINMQDNPLI